MLLKNYIKGYIRTNDKRNPLFVIDGITLSVIGDVHLGRVFRTGVPKHRLGEREQMIQNQFQDLLKRKADYCVIVGDLFDKVRVSNSCLNYCIDSIEQASKENPNTKYIVLSGNHDMSKDTSRVSSFQLLEKYFLTNSSKFKNISIVSSYMEPIKATKNLLLYFSHYNPFMALDEERPNFYKYKDMMYKVAFGHWEVSNFGGDHFIDRHIPKSILMNFDLVVTGHEHKPTLTSIDSVPIYVTGSMQPYAFSEEMHTERDLYLTTTVGELEKKLKKDKDSLKNTNVRILLDTDDTIPEPFECLSLTYKNIGKVVVKQSEDKTVQINEDETKTFQHSFIELVENFKEANTNHSDFLDNILSTFLDKTYKDSV
ncbi:DNA repair exonuclease [Acinetobacter phage vB_AbaM_ME3]|uniref:DNA repair exonuclease n=1 Tax=Acinetobacter phage vB_AbaM_ME3 TaxID=1837876 RepID=A0A172Q089_9CAUD|nr:DNA repair exonuclease [Acinetobacter phage vB_AbaM_ME3]AND75219.1 DNA repair exonuclease [Acinetobacter phage vB_AbaM_ME3]